MINGSEDMERLYEMYLVDCENKGLKPTMHDFTVWLSEEGYDDERISTVRRR